MRPFGFLNLWGISGQIAALVIASIVALHLIITVTFLIHRPDRIEPSIDRRHSQLAATVQLLGATPATERPRLLDDIKRAFPQLDVETLVADDPPAANGPAAPELHGLQRRLGPNYRVFSLADDENVHKVGIALPDGAMLSANLLQDQRQRPFWASPWMTALLFAVITVSLLSLWAARALTAPLSSFAKAAEDFSLNGAAAQIGRASCRERV